MQCRCGERIIASYTRAHLESMKILEGILIQTSSIYQLLQKQFKIAEDERIRKAMAGDSLDQIKTSANSLDLHDLNDILKSTDTSVGNQENISENSEQNSGLGLSDIMDVVDTVDDVADLTRGKRI